MPLTASNTPWVRPEVVSDLLAAGELSEFGSGGVKIGWAADIGWGPDMIARSIAEAKILGISMVRYDARSNVTGGSGWYGHLFDENDVEQIVVLYRGWQGASVSTYIDTAVEYAVEHYKTGARIFEVANEPNISGQIDTDYNVAAEVYAEMVVGLAAALRSELPRDTFTILAGALSRNNSTGWNFLDFSTLLYENGVQGSFDALSVHPYTAPELPTTVASATSDWNRLPLVAALMTASGDAGKKIWATEFSTPTADNAWATTEVIAAAILAEALSLWRSYSWAGPFIHYMLRDNQPGSSETFGIFNYDWTIKAPVWLTMENFTNSGVPKVLP